MRITSVVGARPQFVKLEPIVEAVSRTTVQHTIVHTGQHYDYIMSDVFFADLHIPKPDIELAIGSGTHGRQTGAMLAALDEALEVLRPDWVLVYGDTNSTLAAALSAAKMHISVAHIEAGLRSFNRQMPEEHNRVASDHLADICLAPTARAMENLATEGLGNRSLLVGDVMTDLLYRMREIVQGRKIPTCAQSLNGNYRIATLHRAENTDQPDRLRAIIAALSSLEIPTLLLAHPRLRKRAAENSIDLEVGNLVVLDPVSYPQLIRLLMGSKGVITDSGGLQKEAFLLRIPCTTLRAETEWTETVDLGWNILCQDPNDLARTANRPRPNDTDSAPYGDGAAAGRIIDAIVNANTGPIRDA